jgi:uncharacterized protein (TIGR00645 family)
METVIERVLFACRWLLVPLYLGLAVLLAVFVVREAIELAEIVVVVHTIGKTDLLIKALGLVDLVLVAGLIVMVMISSYENLVSRMTVTRTSNALVWLGKLDAGSLKIRLAVTIIAISTIHLLQELVDAEHVANDKLIWMVIIQLTFVATAVALAVMDWLSAGEEH